MGISLRIYSGRGGGRFAVGLAGGGFVRLGHRHLVRLSKSLRFSRRADRFGHALILGRLLCVRLGRLGFDAQSTAGRRSRRICPSHLFRTRLLGPDLLRRVATGEKSSNCKRAACAYHQRYLFLQFAPPPKNPSRAASGEGAGVFEIVLDWRSALVGGAAGVASAVAPLEEADVFWGGGDRAARACRRAWVREFLIVP